MVSSAEPTLPFGGPAGPGATEAASGATLDELIERLNPRQREAVTHAGGPCLVLAGAGSGKTRVLTHRIAWLVAEEGVPAAAICAVTFTNKAAAEMRERVRRLLGSRPRGLWLSTFHSLGLRLLRRWAGRPGAPGEGFLVYDREASLALWRRCQSALRIGLREYDPGKMLSRCSRAVNRLEDPASWDEGSRPYEQRVAARIWKRYVRAKAEANALDFDDLLYRPLRLLTENADLADEAHRAFRHVLVDEYQDTNRIQYRLVRALLGDRGELMVVGDEDQSIYHWRGADLDNVLDFQEDFPGAKVVRLEQNYRSTQPILAAAGSLVSHNRRRLGKDLWTALEGGEPPVFVPCATERTEAEYITGRLEELHGAEAGPDRGRRGDGDPGDPRSDDDAIGYADCAVLYRTNAQSRVLEEVFLSRGIPYRIVGGQRFFGRREVRDILAWLLLLVRPDDVALRRAVSRPSRGVGDVTLQALAGHTPDLSAAAALERLAASEDPEEALREAGCAPGSVSGLLDLVAVLEELRGLADRVSLAGLVRETLARSGYLEVLAEEDDGEERRANLDQLVAAAEEMEASGAGSDPQQEAGESHERGAPPSSAGESAPEDPGDPASRGPASWRAGGARPEEAAAATAGEGKADRTEVDAGAATAVTRAVGAGRVETGSPGLDRLAAFLDGVALLGDVETEAGQEDGVRLMTVHAAKGLEFHTVFLAGMEDDLFPHASAVADGQLEEERRLCYVGMTRARRRLVMTAARSRRIHGRERWQEPSRFIEEIDPRHVVVREGPPPGGAPREDRGGPAGARGGAGGRKAGRGGGAGGTKAGRGGSGGRGPGRHDRRWGAAGVPPRSSEARKERMQKARTPAHDGPTRPAREEDLRPGAVVVHPMFGAGEVTGAEGSGEKIKLTIRFRKAGKKTVLARYAKLEVPA